MPTRHNAETGPNVTIPFDEGAGSINVSTVTEFEDEPSAPLQLLLVVSTVAADVQSVVVWEDKTFP
jgi:hypothetical protein